MVKNTSKFDDNLTSGFGKNGQGKMVKNTSNFDVHMTSGLGQMVMVKNK